MQTNQLPHYDASVNTTGCCPKFNPDGWNAQELHFRDKLFVSAGTHSLMHVPVDMGRVFLRVQKRIENAGAFDPSDCIVLSRDTSSFAAEHLFSVPRAVPEEEMITLSGDYITQAFEGPYREGAHWHEAMAERVRARGVSPSRSGFSTPPAPNARRHMGRTTWSALPKRDRTRWCV